MKCHKIETQFREVSWSKDLVKRLNSDRFRSGGGGMEVPARSEETPSASAHSAQPLSSAGERVLPTEEVVLGGGVLYLIYSCSGHTSP